MANKLGLSMELIFKDELNSTNAYAIEHMSELSDMSFVYCDVQNAGRGRLDRVWFSKNKQNLYLTIVLKPQGTEFPYINLTQYLCVVLCSVLKEYGVKPQIKWPNDVLINGKKIAGILAQANSQGGTISGVALGVGVNLNSTIEEMNLIDKPATSLNLEIGKVIDREEFLKRLAVAFEKNYEIFSKQGFSFIEHDYMNQACFMNKEITVHTMRESLSGVVKTLTQDGALLLCDNRTNKDIVITMGEIQ